MSSTVISPLMINGVTTGFMITCHHIDMEEPSYSLGWNLVPCVVFTTPNSSSYLAGLFSTIYEHQCRYAEQLKAYCWQKRGQMVRQIKSFTGKLWTEFMSYPQGESLHILHVKLDMLGLWNTFFFIILKPFANQPWSEFVFSWFIEDKTNSSVCVICTI